LGLVHPKDSAFGNVRSIKKAFDALSLLMGKPSNECAEEFLSTAASKCKALIETLIKEQKLDDRTITLYGGGGGAAAMVPYLAQKMNLGFRLSDSSDVISAIGVALALIRDTVERQIPNPTNDDILRIRQEAEAAIASMGAASSSIQVFIEIDPQTSTVRATATGATSLTEETKPKQDLCASEKLALVCDSMKLPADKIKIEGETDHFQAYCGERAKASLLGLIKVRTRPIRVTDISGTIRFQAENGDAVLAKENETEKTISDLVNKFSIWGDAGRTIPNIILFAGTKIIDLSGLMAIEQVLSLAKAELDALPSDCQVIVVATQI